MSKAFAGKPGYNRPLWILPFDHRGSFQSKMFGIHGTPTAEETKMIASYKEVVYDGFEEAVRSGLPKQDMGILVDEQFGQNVIRRAKAAGFAVSVPAEKSGQDEFDFEYGDQFREHIDQLQPTFVKVLVRYNVESDPEMNRRQAERLADLSTFLSPRPYYYMFELLVPPTDEQLKKCGGKKEVFDRELRPQLMVRAIEELRDAGVEADIWKVEGLDSVHDFEKISAAARAGGRDHVSCIVLGRGENEAKVREWLTIGAHTKGVVGFAVGRTVFWEPLKALREGKVNREQAVTQIANIYKGFCQLWQAEKKG